MQGSQNYVESSNLGKGLKLCPLNIFQCQFCPRSFKTKQALGGHQNAHLSERKKIGQQYPQGRGRLSKLLAAANKTSDIAIKGVESNELSPQGTGPKPGFKPRFGQRFEPYLKVVDKSKLPDDHNILWVFKDGLALPGLLSNATSKIEDKFVEESVKIKEDEKIKEIINLDLRL